MQVLVQKNDLNIREYSNRTVSITQNQSNINISEY